jgi:hypothetical protein
MYQQPPPSLHSGMTFEANLGLGWIRVSENDKSDTSDLGVGGLNLGVGGWVSPKLAITARLAGATLSDNGLRLTQLFLGPSAQFWIDDHFWLGGGVGLGAAVLSNDNDSEGVKGVGLDLRIGYSFVTTSENTFNASVELTPSHLTENGDSADFTGIALLLGYQHL